jgi:fructose-1,6-bisphosphatase/inositol monophosphatase family enzyme
VLRERIGSGAMMRQMGSAMMDFMMAASGWIRLSESHGPEAIAAKIRDMLDGNVGAEEGIILRP